MMNSVTYFCLLIVLVCVIQQVAGDCDGCLSDDKKCYTQGQFWTKEIKDLRVQFVCNNLETTEDSSDGTVTHFYTAVVNNAECVIGGTLVNNGEKFEDVEKCKIYSCEVYNLGQTIDKVNSATTEVPMPDCTPTA